MKTKEIDCYVHVNKGENGLSNPYSNISLHWTEDEEKLDGREVQMKAKLIIELPERKKEFTESQVRKAISNARCKSWKLSDRDLDNTIISELFDE